MPHENDYSMMDDGSQSQRLTNDDFRKLLMTPRGSSGSSSTHAPGSIREAMANASKKSMPPPSSERHEARRKKKNYYAALKKQEDTKLQELADKYRDRARERRDGANPDYQAMDSVNSAAATNAYRAVAPDIKTGMDVAERRRQMIQESKFLGGDMEHTHLVKGLDYALLQKVRSEIIVKEHEQEIEMEKLVEEAIIEKEKADAAAEADGGAESLTAAGDSNANSTTIKQPGSSSSSTPFNNNNNNNNDEPEYRTAMGRNILNTIQFYRSRHIERNELFAPGRMAYVIEIEDDTGESDIPTTLIRSKVDVPYSTDDIQTLTTNDIVINKLSQILSYLRQGGRGKKNKRRDKDKLIMFKEMDNFDVEKSAGGMLSTGKLPNQQSNNNNHHQQQQQQRHGGGGPDPDHDGGRSHVQNLSIYDDVDDYKPTSSTSRRHQESRHDNNRSNKSNRRGGGIDNDDDDDADDDIRKSRKYFDKSSEQEEREHGNITIPPPPKISTNLISKLTAEPEGYAECYPGLQEMNDAIDDSDDEVDYTKMDLGNKKGPIGRWDFDTQEEYSDYMSTKEALPKAAFQYGVKMQDGRKTRKHKTEKNEKAELDREWQKIQNIIHKRKTKGGGDEPEYKSAKYQ